MARQKIQINGYDFWLDKKAMVLYDKEDSKNGLVFDVVCGHHIRCSHMTEFERNELSKYYKE